MKTIPLTQGKEAIVDDEMFEIINSVAWHAVKDDGRFYVRRHDQEINGKRGFIHMHHVVMGRPLYGLQIDHINGNPLDNRRSNLRIVSQRENSSNTRKQRESLKTSRFVGVNWDKARSKWKARIYLNRKHVMIGRFDVEEMAHDAYQKKLAESVFGPGTGN